jgi:hypothetical protein
MNTKATARYDGPDHPPWWQVSETWQTPQGKQVVHGQQLLLKGGRMVFAFVNHTIAPPRPGSGKRAVKEWITLLGPGGYRAVYPDQIGKILPPPVRKPARPARRRAS